MRTLLALLFLLPLLPLRAVEIFIEWDAPDAETAQLVAATQLYERKPDGTVTKIGAAMGLDTFVKIDFPEGKHTIYAAFLDAEGAPGLPSEDLTFHILKRPGTPRIKVALQRSTDLQDWQTVAVMEGPEDDREFFKLAFVTSP